MKKQPEPPTPEPPAPPPVTPDPIALRYRTDGWTVDRQRDFLEALADSGIIRHAAGEVGMSEQSVTRLRRRAGAESFDLACEAALRIGARRLRSIAFERAVEGQVKRHYYHGELVSEERVFDNRLLICLLGKHQYMFTDQAPVRKAAQDWDGLLARLTDAGAEGEPGAPPPLVINRPGEKLTLDADIWYDDDQDEWRTSLPPPDDFVDEEQDCEPSDEYYSRTLTDAEHDALEVHLAAHIAPAAAKRDAFMARNRPHFSSQEAEPSTPSGANPPPAPP